MDVIVALDPHELLARLTTAGTERRLAEKTLSAYKRTWLQLVAWATAEEKALELLPKEDARRYYEELTRGRGPSHHLQVRAAIAAVYRELGQPNPFASCIAPPFDIDKVELRYLPVDQIGKVLAELRIDGQDYYGRLVFHLAEALFRTGKRYNEWASLSRDKLVRVGDGDVARMKTKGGKFADVPLPARLADSLREWTIYLDAAKGVRVRKGSLDFATSGLVFPGRDGKALSNQAFNARLKAACRAAGVPEITAHGLRHSAATWLLNQSGVSLRDIQRYLGHRSLATTGRYTHVEHDKLRSMAASLEESTEQGANL
ncbi:MAG: tyrosine-type recombinase/integrase [Chthoniobacterales bacterium]